MTATIQPGLTKPSEITEPGWYFAEERIDDDGDGSDYQLTVLCVDRLVSDHRLINGAMRFVVDNVAYDCWAADNWFRIIRRIEEPEVRGGWA